MGIPGTADALIATPHRGALVDRGVARIGGARSEVVVRASHACLQHPELIREVERILDGRAAGPARPLGSLPTSPGTGLLSLRRPADAPSPIRPGVVLGYGTP